MLTSTFFPVELFGELLEELLWELLRDGYIMEKQKVEDDI